MLNEVDKPLEEMVLLRRSGAFATATDSQLQRDENVRLVLLETLATLESRFDDVNWLSRQQFGVTDLNVASVVALAGPSAIDLSSRPRVGSWLGSCLSRPAAQSVFKKVVADATDQGFIGDLSISQ